MGAHFPDQAERFERPAAARRRPFGLLASAVLHASLMAAAVLWIGTPQELERGGDTVIPVELLMVGPVEQTQHTPQAQPEEPAPDQVQLQPLEPASPAPPLVKSPAPEQPLIEEPVRQRLEEQKPMPEPLPEVLQKPLPDPLPWSLPQPPPEPDAPLAAVQEPVTPEPIIPRPPEPPETAPALAHQIPAQSRTDQPLPSRAAPIPPMPRTPTAQRTQPVPQRTAAAQRTQAEPRRQPARAAGAPSGRPPAAARPTAARPASERGGTSGSAATAGAGEVASWRARVLAHLARFKTYPEWARDQGVEGRALVAFTITRSGQVTAVSLAGSSGASILDQATLAMVRRAAPFPAMPAGGPASMSFTAAIRYDLR
jgi:protein TonB